MKRYIVKSRNLVLATVAALVLVATSVAPASAASAGLSINPRKNYIVDPGKSTKDKLTVGNLSTKEDLNLTLRVIDFGFLDESGSPKLMIGENVEQTAWSAKPFIKVPEKVMVPAGTTKTIEIEVKVPANQGAGSYYSAIQYSSNGDEGGNVNLNASGVSLVFLSVPGEVKEKMTLEKIGNWQRDPDGGGGKYIGIATDESPSIVGFTLKNDGNVVEAPVGSAEIKDMFGNVVTTIEEVNPNNNLALIGQSRRFEACIKPIERKIERDERQSKAVTCDKTSLKPGRYTANLSAYYGQNGNNTYEVLGTATFWYLPIWFLLAVLGGLLLIAYVVWRIVRKIKGAGSGTKSRRFSR